MGKKIYLSPSNQDGNTYATGGTNEMEQCNRIAAAAETALKRCGFRVKRAPKGQNMTVSINESNAWGADLHVPIHTNAGGGKGPEVFVHSTALANMKIAKPVYNELAKASYSKVGRYIGTYRYGGTLAELQNTNAIAVYCECEFHDNPSIAKWIINNVATIGEAICRGICTGYGVKYVAPSSGNSGHSNGSADNQVYRVRKSWDDAKSQVGAYHNLTNAKNCANAHKGYFVFDSKGKKVFTPATAANTVTVNGKTSFIRAGGHCAAKKLATVKTGVRLTWLSDDGWGWSKVQHGDIIGWIQNSRICGKNGLSTWREAICNGTGVQVREAPTTSSKAIKTLNKGARFSVTCLVPSEDNKNPNSWIMTGEIIKGKDVYVYNGDYITIGDARKK